MHETFSVLIRCFVIVGTKLNQMDTALFPDLLPYLCISDVQHVMPMRPTVDATLHQH